MIYRGLIIKIRSKYAIVLTESNNYYKIEIKNNMIVGNKIKFLDDDIINIDNSKKIKKSIVFALVACLLLITIVTINLIPKNAFALVSIDINPSIELQLDKDAIVIDIFPLNDDAISVINKNMIGHKVTKVIDKIIKNAEDLNFITEENSNILISSSTLNNKDINNIQSLITEYIDKNEHLSNDLSIVYLESDEKTAKKALKEDKSLGKLEISNLTSTKEDKDLSIKEMINDNEISSIFTKNIISKNNIKKINHFIIKLESKLTNIKKEFPTEYNEIIEFISNTKKLILLDTTNSEKLLVTTKSKWQEYQNRLAKVDNNIKEDILELVKNLKSLSPDIAEVNLYLNNIDKLLNDENTNLRQLGAKTKVLWEKYKKINEKREKDLEELNELINKLKTIPFSNLDLDFFLSKYDALIKDNNTDLKELKNNAKKLWNKYKKSIDNKVKNNNKKIIK